MDSAANNSSQRVRPSHDHLVWLGVFPETVRDRADKRGFVRLAAMLIGITEAAAVIVDRRFDPGIAQTIVPYHAVNIAFAAMILFAIRREWSERLWKPLAFAELSIFLGTCAAISVIDGSVVINLINIVVVTAASAAFMPWGIVWQAALNLVAMASFVSNTTLVPADRYTIEIWVALPAVLILTAVISGFVSDYRISISKFVDAVRASREHLCAMIEAMPECVMLMGASDGRLLQINRAGVAMMEAESALELMGRSVFELMMPEYRERARHLGRSAAGGQQAKIDLEMITLKGSHRWVESHAIPFRGEPAENPIVMVVGRDVTHRRRNDIELAAARDAALESTRLKTEFLANMSHELRTPLNVILGANSIIEDHLCERGDDALATFTDAIARAGRDLTDTLHAIIDFSTLEAGSFRPHAVEVHVKPMLDRIVADFERPAAEKHLDLTLIVSEDDPVVMFDEYCLRHAVRHLLDNAIKFTASGLVTVRLDRDARGVLRISVCDTGIGVAEEYLPRLFEPFSQEYTGYSRPYPGSGLGLALVRRYVELNGASISVRSEQGIGSEFVISFASGESGMKSGSMPSPQLIRAAAGR